MGLLASSVTHHRIIHQFGGNLQADSTRNQPGALSQRALLSGTLHGQRMGPQGVRSRQPPRAKLTCSFFLFIFISPILCGSVLFLWPVLKLPLFDKLKWRMIFKSSSKITYTQGASLSTVENVYISQDREDVCQVGSATQTSTLTAFPLPMCLKLCRYSTILEKNAISKLLRFH